MNPREEIEALEQLLDQLLSGIQDVLQSGEVLSDEFQGMLAEELTATTTRIDELRAASNVPEPPEGPPPEIPQGQPPSPGAQLMWILAGQQPDAFVNYLRSYPDPELNALVSNPAELQRVLAQLQQSNPTPEQQPVADGVEKAPLNSSNIYGFKYDPKSGRLRVRFQSGSVYSYDGVPPGVFKVFQQGAVPAQTTGRNRFGRWWTGKIPSLGAAFYQMIRNGGYQYQRLR